MKSRNKDDEKKKKIINLFIFKYMIDYCNSNLFSFLDYIESSFADVEGISIEDIMQEFIKLSESIKGDII